MPSENTAVTNATLQTDSASDKAFFRNELEYQKLLLLAKSMAGNGLLKPDELQQVQEKLVLKLRPGISELIQKNFT